MITLPRDILAALRWRTARSALGASSMRGAGSRGVVDAGRRFLCVLELQRFAVPTAARFRRELDRATNELVRAFPRKARRWGLARKGINIFLRDCLYTIYLREAYGLGIAEQFFEVPLDSLTGRALYEASLRRLPRWRTVRGLKPDVSDEFQEVALDLANRRGIARVHLDAIWWGQRTA
jgi:hypothetical protein